jgi:hypothetical protein
VKVALIALNYCESVAAATVASLIRASSDAIVLLPYSSAAMASSLTCYSSLSAATTAIRAFSISLLRCYCMSRVFRRSYSSSRSNSATLASARLLVTAEGSYFRSPCYDVRPNSDTGTAATRSDRTIASIARVKSSAILFPLTSSSHKVVLTANASSKVYPPVAPISFQRKSIFSSPLLVSSIRAISVAPSVPM